MGFIKWPVLILLIASIAGPVAIAGWTLHPLLGIAAGLVTAGGILLQIFWRPKIHK